MIKLWRHKLPLAMMTFLCILLFSVTAFAKNMDELTGPGVQPTEPEVEETVPEFSSLGTYMTTAYCSCSKCSGNKLTYAGTVPTANHTISADLNVFPLGTKLKINDIVYTVEDKGTGVNGNKLDIFFDSHAAALQYGVQNAEVYQVN